MIAKRKKWRTKLFKASIVLLLLLGAAIYWLFYDNQMPNDGSFPIDLATIRTEATRIAGDKPLRIEVETVSHTKVPKIAIVAGTDWNKIDMVRNSYRVVFEQGSIVIDTGYDAKTAKVDNVDRFDEAAWQHVLKAMDSATHIVVTHEHIDHLGGLILSPHLAQILPKAILTPKQFTPSNHVESLQWPQGSHTGYKPVSYDRLLAIAPGVVLIAAPGHTPGSQMVYVQRTDGREYIFMGDTASHADNVRLMRMRSHFVTDLKGSDDRHAVLLQLKTLHQLSLDQPQIALIPGHDAIATAEFEQRGLLVRGFGV